MRRLRGTGVGLLLLGAVAPVVVVDRSFAGGGEAVRCFGRRATIVGTPGRDVIRLTRQLDVVVALGGDDEVFDPKGFVNLSQSDPNPRPPVEDIVCAGPGNDRVTHADRVDAGPGNDRVADGTLVYGGPGDDVLIIHDCRPSRIEGGPGKDWIHSGHSATREEGTEENPHVMPECPGDHDRVFGGDGDDRINGGDGDDRLFGGGGNDRIFGVLGSDRVYGRSGDDVLGGGEDPERGRYIFDDGDDLLEGGRGRDRLDGGRGTDSCDGGPGRDELQNCEIV
jgi:Ca2+-binding RTX toxin-like protein